jgi:hypothetical protein
MATGMIDAQASVALVREERRGPERAVAVLMNAGIAQGGRNGLCRIRNLSSGGIMVETRVPMAVDAPVSLQLRSGREIEGKVHWSKDHLAGIALAAADAEELLGDRAAHPPVATWGAYPRFARLAPAYIIINHRRQRCGMAAISLADVSLTGMGDLRAGQLVRVGMDGLGEHLAEISHVEGETALASFAQPLLFKPLEQWLEASFVPSCQGGSAVRHDI